MTLHFTAIPRPVAPYPGEGADIIAEVATDHGMTTAQMLERTRVQTVVVARQDAMLALHRAGFSTPRIGRLLGGPTPYDHTTVLHGIGRALAREDGAE